MSFGLIYCDPSRELNFWRPTPEALLALDFRSFAVIPALKELEEWFDTQEEMRVTARLDLFFEKTQKLALANARNPMVGCVDLPAITGA